jgi:hypothetical protein
MSVKPMRLSRGERSMVEGTEPANDFFGVDGFEIIVTRRRSCLVSNEGPL